MARILFLSPLPPAETGVATYSRAVLDQLGRTGVTARHDIEAPWPLPEDVDRRVADADLTVYQIGNNVRFHGELYRLAVTHPGLVTLHELALDELVRGWVERGEPLGERTRRDAEAARRRLGRRPAGAAGPLETPWFAYLARRSRGVIVHSPFGRRYLEEAGTRTPVYVAPHPTFPEAARVPKRRAARRVARRLRDARGRTVVGVLGDLGGHKGIDAVLRAARGMQEAVHVALVGRRIPGYDPEEAVRAAGMEGAATVAPDVSDEEFAAWLHSCDVVVNLRHPHRGEVSGTVIRALQAGVATVVSAEGTYLDWPDDAVVRVAPGLPSEEELASVLDDLVAHPDRREAVGRAARAHMARLEREGRTARAYEEAIEGTLRLLRDPARPALSRWAAALMDCGVTEDALRHGMGTGYAEALQEIAAAAVPSSRGGAAAALDEESR